jgi:beta-glucosidase
MWFTSAALLLGVELVAAQTYQNHTSNGTLNAPGSRPYYPSPWSSGKGDWAEAYAKAQAFVGQMTLLEKVNLTTGTGWQSNRCVGNVGAVPRLNLHALCMQDGPLGIRFADYNSAFPAGGTVAAVGPSIAPLVPQGGDRVRPTSRRQLFGHLLIYRQAWDKDVWYQRGHDLGSEFRDKGIDVMLGPAVGPLGRIPTGGRIWEGFSPDPFLSGVAVAQTVKGIQDAGVVATTKHYILNEQEHFRQATEYPEDNIVDSLSSNIDDVSMHETYLW